MDYEFDYDDNKYIVQHISDGELVTIMDCDGDEVFHVHRMGRWEGAMPQGLAIMALFVYGQGHEAGNKHGYWRCQYDVRKVLGL